MPFSFKGAGPEVLPHCLPEQEPSAQQRVPLVEKGALTLVARTLLSLYSRAARKG